MKDTDDPKVRVQFLRQVGNCPSGRLIAVDKHEGESIEPKPPHSIGLVRIRRRIVAVRCGFVEVSLSSTPMAKPTKFAIA